MFSFIHKMDLCSTFQIWQESGSYFHPEAMFSLLNINEEKKLPANSGKQKSQLPSLLHL
jgi:hypothetical protein